MKYRICTRCVMDTSDPKIEFDENGWCNHCRDYLLRAPEIVYGGAASDRLREQMIEKVLRAGKGRDFDCVLGVSGGVDSSYLARLSKKWGLRVLALQMDNGWNSEEAVKNIKRVCEAYQCEYQSYVLDWEEFRKVQLAFLKASIVEMEIPTDVAIVGALHRTAVQHGVRFIFSGGNLATEGILPQSWFYYPKDSRLLHSICRRFGVGPVKNLPTFDYVSEIYYKFCRGVRIVYPLNNVPYSRAEAVSALKSDCGWVEYGAKHHESRFTKFVQGYVQPVKFGVDYRRATLSTQICNADTTREEALLILERTPYDSDAVKVELEYVAKKLKISEDELGEILAAAPKTYKDYPNNERLLRFVYSTYRKLFGKNRSFPSAAYD